MNPNESLEDYFEKKNRGQTSEGNKGRCSGNTLENINEGFHYDNTLEIYR